MTEGAIDYASQPRQIELPADEEAPQVKEKILPKGMGRRLLTMTWFTLALGFTGFGNATELVYIPFFAWIGVAFTLLIYAIWRERTRPKVNGFWILAGIVWFALTIPLATDTLRVYLGVVAAIPVALLWLHDAPGTPNAMLTWGLLVTLLQDFSVWDQAGADTAFYVVVAMVLVIGAAQAERERLAQRKYAPTGRLWMAARLGAILAWSLILVAGREALQAISVFTYLGLDLRGTAGKVTMLMLILASIAMAAMLWRVRPYKEVDPYEQPKDDKGRRIARESKVVERIDFDDRAVKAAKRPKTAAPADARTAAKPAKPSGQKPASAGPLRPGEIDFD